MAEGIVFNIQRFSIYDGPGARTAVFFKGCNLSCKWCHNPESIKMVPELAFYPDKCIGCGKCFEVCPQKAHITDKNSSHIINRTLCSSCMKCADTCYAEALVKTGEIMTTDELFEALKTDVLYYERSGGGVTFTGGECMQQIDFLAEILGRLHAAGINTAVDTAGNQPWEKFERIINDTDIFLYDIKAASSAVHKQLTGVTNELIISNLKTLYERGKRIWVRIPYIPGFNDKEMPGITEILSEIRVERVEIMPYHRLGEGKYKAFGRENCTLNTRIPEAKEIDEIVSMLRQKNIPAFKA